MGSKYSGLRSIKKAPLWSCLFPQTPVLPLKWKSPQQSKNKVRNLWKKNCGTYQWVFTFAKITDVIKKYRRTGVMMSMQLQTDHTKCENNMLCSPLSLNMWASILSGSLFTKVLLRIQGKKLISPFVFINKHI